MGKNAHNNNNAIDIVATKIKVNNSESLCIHDHLCGLHHRAEKEMGH